MLGIKRWWHTGRLKSQAKSLAKKENKGKAPQQKVDQFKLKLNRLGARDVKLANRILRGEEFQTFVDDTVRSCIVAPHLSSELVAEASTPLLDEKCGETSDTLGKKKKKRKKTKEQKREEKKRVKQKAVESQLFEGLSDVQKVAVYCADDVMLKHFQSEIVKHPDKLLKQAREKEAAAVCLLADVTCGRQLKLQDISELRQLYPNNQLILDSSISVIASDQEKVKQSWGTIKAKDNDVLSDLARKHKYIAIEYLSDKEIFLYLKSDFVTELCSLHNGEPDFATAVATLLCKDLGLLNTYWQAAKLLPVALYQKALQQKLVAQKLLVDSELVAKYTPEKIVDLLLLHIENAAELNDPALKTAIISHPKIDANFSQFFIFGLALAVDVEHVKSIFKKMELLQWMGVPFMLAQILSKHHAAPELVTILKDSLKKIGAALGVDMKAVSKAVEMGVKNSTYQAESIEALARVPALLKYLSELDVRFLYKFLYGLEATADGSTKQHIKEIFTHLDGSHNGDYVKDVCKNKKGAFLDLLSVPGLLVCLDITALQDIFEANKSELSFFQRFKTDKNRGEIVVLFLDAAQADSFVAEKFFELSEQKLSCIFNLQQRLEIALAHGMVGSYLPHLLLDSDDRNNDSIDSNLYGAYQKCLSLEAIETYLLICKRDNNAAVMRQRLSYTLAKFDMFCESKSPSSYNPFYQRSQENSDFLGLLLKNELWDLMMPDMFFELSSNHGRAFLIVQKENLFKLALSGVDGAFAFCKVPVLFERLSERDFLQLVDQFNNFEGLDELPEAYNLRYEKIRDELLSKNVSIKEISPPDGKYRNFFTDNDRSTLQRSAQPNKARSWSALLTASEPSVSNIEANKEHEAALTSSLEARRVFANSKLLKKLSYSQQLKLLLVHINSSKDPMFYQDLEKGNIGCRILTYSMTGESSRPKLEPFNVFALWRGLEKTRERVKLVKFVESKLLSLLTDNELDSVQKWVEGAVFLTDELSLLHYFDGRQPKTLTELQERYDCLQARFAKDGEEGVDVREMARVTEEAFLQLKTRMQSLSEFSYSLGERFDLGNLKAKRDRMMLSTHSDKTSGEGKKATKNLEATKAINNAYEELSTAFALLARVETVRKEKRIDSAYTDLSAALRVLNEEEKLPAFIRVELLLRHVGSKNREIVEKFREVQWFDLCKNDKDIAVLVLKRAPGVLDMEQLIPLREHYIKSECTHFNDALEMLGLSSDQIPSLEAVQAAKATLMQDGRFASDNSMQEKLQTAVSDLTQALDFGIVAEIDRVLANKKARQTEESAKPKSAEKKSGGFGRFFRKSPAKAKANGAAATLGAGKGPS